MTDRAPVSRHLSDGLVPAAKQLLDALGGIDDMVYYMNPDGSVSGLNPAGRNLVGLSSAKLETDPLCFIGLIHPDDAADARRVMAERPASFGFDYRLRHVDGGWRWMHSHRLGVQDESGKVAGYICQDRDITVQKSTEEAVKAEHSRAQEYLNIAEVILVAIDADEKVTMINRKGCQILGYDEPEILGSVWFDRFIPAGERESTRTAFKQLMAGDVPPFEYFENSVVTRDGRERLIAWHNTLLRDEQGRITGTLSSGEDVTERKRAEKALRQAEEQFRALLEGTTSCIVVIRDRIVTYANEATLQAFGYRREEMMGQDTSLVHLSHESYEEGQRAVYEAVQQRGSWQGEWCLKHKDGTPIWMDTYVSALPDGSVVVVLHDITDRIQAKAALSEREAELSSIFRVAPVGIGLVANRVLRQVNQKMCEMLGYKSEELIGQSARVLYPTEEEFDAVGREKYDQIRRQGTGSVETQWRRKDGTIIDVLLSSTPVDPNDWSRGITFTALDITQRKKSEQALVDKNIALREILNQVSKDQEEIREQIATNIGEAVVPTLKRLKESAAPSQQLLVRQLEKDIELISAPFLELLKKRHPRLTPRETEICRLIKNGFTSKQVAESLNVSLGTIHKYRELIRRKLGLANVDINLTSFLQSF